MHPIGKSFESFPNDNCTNDIAACTDSKGSGKFIESCHETAVTICNVAKMILAIAIVGRFFLK